MRRNKIKRVQQQLQLGIFTALFLLVSVSFSFAQAHGDTTETTLHAPVALDHSADTHAVEAHKEEASKTDFIFHHIADAHDWHFMTIGHTHVSISLPIIVYSPTHGLSMFMSSKFLDEHHHPVAYQGYYLDSHNKVKAEDATWLLDLSITKNVTSMIISVTLLLLVFITAAKGYKGELKAPKGVQSFVEPLILFVRDGIAKPNIGKHHERFMPYLLTIFFFIFFNNLMGLLPGAANVTGNIAVTITLAILTFIITNVNGNKSYWKHIFATPGVPVALLPLMIVIEFIGLFTKPFSLTVRLFANITAGHIIILSILGLVFIIESAWVGFGSVPLAVMMSFLELLVAFIQAFVFTLLSSIYIGQAVVEHDHH